MLRFLFSGKKWLPDPDAPADNIDFVLNHHEFTTGCKPQYIDTTKAVSAISAWRRELVLEVSKRIYKKQQTGEQNL